MRTGRCRNSWSPGSHRWEIYGYWRAQFWICKCVHYAGSAPSPSILGHSWLGCGRACVWGGPSTLIEWVPRARSGLGISIALYACTRQAISNSTSQFHFPNIITLLGHVRERPRCPAASPVPRPPSEGHFARVVACRSKVCIQVRWAK